MHKYGLHECPDYKDYPSFFIIKMYHGGHFENEHNKFVGYKLDYFDVCNVDLMSMFEVAAMASEAISRKSAGADMYIKTPNEGMECVGRLKTDADVLLMTGLIYDKVQYIEYCLLVVLVEPLAVEGLPLGTQTNNENVPIIDVDEVDNSSSALHSTSESSDVSSGVM
ncbi:hypothetical protein ACET3Z_005546 [Daucus carota]